LPPSTIAGFGPRLKNILRINAMEVEDEDANKLELPDDYKYEDAKPGDPVAPKLISWADDKTRKAYLGVQTTDEVGAPDPIRQLADVAQQSRLR